MQPLKMANPQRHIAGIRRCLHSSVSAHKETTFLLSDPGEGIAEVEVLQWHVSIGQEVEEFDTIAELQSDKATGMWACGRFFSPFFVLSRISCISLSLSLSFFENCPIRYSILSFVFLSV
jgi:Biotin-requiring enzyme